MFEHCRMTPFQRLHVPCDPTFQPVRFPTVVEEEHQDVAAPTEHDLVVLELDAPHVTMAHRAERLVHEIDDRGEHRRDEIRVRAGREAAGKVDHRDATAVDEEDMVHDGANPGHGCGDLRPEVLNASGAVIRDDSRAVSRDDSAGGGEKLSEAKEVRFPDASSEVELRGIVHAPERASAGLVITHGRSNDLRNPLIRRLAEAVASEGIWALRLNFRYVDAKGQASRDLSREEDDLRGAVRFAREATAVAEDLRRRQVDGCPGLRSGVRGSGGRRRHRVGISAPPAVPTRGPPSARVAVPHETRIVRAGGPRPLLYPRPSSVGAPAAEGNGGPRRGGTGRALIRADRRETGHVPRGPRSNRALDRWPDRIGPYRMDGLP